MRERTQFLILAHSQLVEDQGAHIQAAENLAEPVGSFFRRRNEITTHEGFFMIAPTLKEEERPALTDTTGSKNRGDPTIAECEAKCKVHDRRSTNVVFPAASVRDHFHSRQEAWRHDRSQPGTTRAIASTAAPNRIFC